MRKNLLHNAGSGFLQRSQLLKLKLKAMRSGVWFKRLPRIDRVLVDLTIKVASAVHSFTLATNILTVIRKLESIMESKFSRAVIEIGFPIARKICLIGQKLGNANAKEWEFDVRFAQFCAAMSFNEPKLFRG